VGARFSALAQIVPGAHPASCATVIGSLSLGVKGARRDVGHPPPLSRIKKEYSYSSNPPPPLGVHVLFYGDIYLLVLK